ncbi:MAG: trehalose-6-phosphate synthase [Minwuia sp.]|nr:trehalose-6-phosphate synthase [Minwuia sp.]
MSRLIVVSNRVQDPAAGPGVGGLAVALGEALNSSGGIWVGWNGHVEDDPTLPVSWQEERSGNLTLLTTSLTQEEHQGYYLGFANRVLWPAFHYRLDLVDYTNAHTRVYGAVNRRLAMKIATILKPDDRIWIHDYHLIPLAAELRAAGCGNPIGYFQHIPLPPPSILTAVPEYSWLVRALFAYDVVGFQTETDRQHLIQQVCQQESAATVDGEYVTAFGRSTRVKSYPIGIDVDRFGDMARTADAQEIIDRLHRRNLNRAQVIGVDRLDYSKGLPERLESVRRLLELYPENRGAMTFMQIAPTSRGAVDAYVDLHERLDSLSGEINSKFSDFDWTPIRYINRQFPRETLAALYRASRAALITPLRDGMNLVAHEYVVAQDPEDPGMPVLSRFAGAADYMKDAVLINPYNIDETAIALQTALQMPLKERQRRHERLMDVVRDLDVSRWSSRFLNDLGQLVRAIPS